MHQDHPDGLFCRTNNYFVEQLAPLLRPNQVCYLSQDDKARVTIGITAAHKQSTFLMHMEYRVKLPEYDFVKAERHKIIPSVVAGIIINQNGIGTTDDVTYSGPTYVAIRSGKHDSSTAMTHAFDFERIKLLPEFTDILWFKAGRKPILII